MKKKQFYISWFLKCFSFSGKNAFSSFLLLWVSFPLFSQIYIADDTVITVKEEGLQLKDSVSEGSNLVYVFKSTTINNHKNDRDARIASVSNRPQKTIRSLVSARSNQKLIGDEEKKHSAGKIVLYWHSQPYDKTFFLTAKQSTFFVTTTFKEFRFLADHKLYGLNLAIAFRSNILGISYYIRKKFSSSYLVSHSIRPPPLVT